MHNRVSLMSLRAQSWPWFSPSLRCTRYTADVLRPARGARLARCLNAARPRHRPSRIATTQATGIGDSSQLGPGPGLSGRAGHSRIPQGVATFYRESPAPALLPPPGRSQSAARLVCGRTDPLCPSGGRPCSRSTDARRHEGVDHSPQTPDRGRCGRGGPRSGACPGAHRGSLCCAGNPGRRAARR